MLDHRFNLIPQMVTGISIQMLLVEYITDLLLVVQHHLVQELMYHSSREKRMLEVLTRNYTSLESLYLKNLIMQRIQKRDLYYKSQDQLLLEQMQTSHQQRLIVLIMTTNVIIDLLAPAPRHQTLLQLSQNYHTIQMLVIK